MTDNESIDCEFFTGINILVDCKLALSLSFIPNCAVLVMDMVYECIYVRRFGVGATCSSIFETVLKLSYFFGCLHGRIVGTRCGHDSASVQKMSHICQVRE